MKGEMVENNSMILQHTDFKTCVIHLVYITKVYLPAVIPVSMNNAYRRNARCRAREDIHYVLDRPKEVCFVLLKLIEKLNLFLEYAELELEKLQQKFYLD